MICSQSSIFKAINFKEKLFDLTEKESKSEFSNKSFFEIFDKQNHQKGFLLNENIEIENSNALFERTEELKLLSEKKLFNELKTIQDELENYKNVDFRSIFNKQPTQLKNINNNKLKAFKEMENLMAVDETQVNPVDNVKVENEIQLLNKKRKQSDGLSELRKELLEKYLILK